MQKWTRLNFYVEDFLNLVYRYYNEHGIAYVCTYYHLDLTNSICDKEILNGASYETIGDLSGLVWEKILMLPTSYAISSTRPTKRFWKIRSDI